MMAASANYISYDLFLQRDRQTLLTSSFSFSYKIKIPLGVFFSFCILPWAEGSGIITTVSRVRLLTKSSWHPKFENFLKMVFHQIDSMGKKYDLHTTFLFWFYFCYYNDERKKDRNRIGCVCVYVATLTILSQEEASLSRACQSYR
jgi:hypothetical protein